MPSAVAQEPVTAALPPAEDPNSELNSLRRELRELQATLRQAQLLTAAQQDELIRLRADAASAAAREAALETRLLSERARVQSTMAAAEALVASLRKLEAARPLDADEDDDCADDIRGGSISGDDDGDGEGVRGSPLAMVVDSDYLNGGDGADGAGGRDGGGCRGRHVSSPAASDISAALASHRWSEAMDASQGSAKEPEWGETADAPRVTAEIASKLRNAAVDATSGGLLVASRGPVGSPTASIDGNPPAAATGGAALTPLALPSALSPAPAAGAGFAAALKEMSLAYVCGDAHEGDVYALAAALDGGVVASSGDDRVVRVFETGMRRVVGRLTESGRAVTALGFATDGGMLAAGSFDGFLRFYARADTGRKKGRWLMHSVLPGHTGIVRRVVFDAAAPEDSPRVYSASTDRSIKLTDIAAGKRPFVVNTPSAVLDIDVLPGSQTVVSGHKDGGLRIWSARSGGGDFPEVSAKAHTRAITSVCCLEDGYGVLTLGRDDVLKLSDMRLLGESVREMESGVRVVSDWHRATLCGRVAACGLGQSGSLGHWNVDSGKLLRRRLCAGASHADDSDVLGLLNNKNPGCVVLPLWTSHGLVAAHKCRQLSIWQ
jgi:WD domain, G-beta repeat